MTHDPRRDDVHVLQDKPDLGGVGIGKKAERPKIGLAEMPKTNQPQAGGEKMQLRLADWRTEPVAVSRRIPQGQAHRASTGKRSLTGDKQECLIDRERGGEHRRKRHNWPKHGRCVNIGRDDSAVALRLIMKHRI